MLKVKEFGCALVKKLHQVLKRRDIKDFRHVAKFFSSPDLIIVVLTDLLNDFRQTKVRVESENRKALQLYFLCCATFLKIVSSLL